MARSRTSTFSPSIVKQSVAAEAQNAGYAPRAARHRAHAYVASVKTNKADSAGLSPRNLGRRVQWRGASFIPRNQVDDGRSDDRYDDDEDEFDSIVEVVEPRAEFTISLMDLATQSRPRGIAKQFEMVEDLPKVIVLDDDDFDWAEENEWEDLAKGETLEEPLKVSEEPKKSYKAALTNANG